MNNSEKVPQFLEELNDIQKIAYNIAKDHLGTSFDISKCNGFIDFIKTQT